MSKATLTFDLPEEEQDLRAALNGGQLLGAAEEFSSYLRGLLKHGNLTDDTYKVVEDVRRNWLDFMGDLL